MRYLFLLLLFIPLLVKAQPTFTYAAFAPQPGDQYTVSNSNTYCPGNAGANQTWNFAASSTWGTSTYSVVPVSTVPCGTYFPNATISIGTSGYNNFNITSTAYLMYGSCQTPGMPRWGYSDPDKIVEFPMTYGYSFSDTYEGPDLSFGGYRTASVTVTYEGYGTVTTPNGTYTNAICIHREVTQTDSSSNVSICTGDEYYWFAQGYRYPVVQTWYYPFSAQCSSSGSGTMFLQSITIGMEEHSSNPTLSISPNPVSSELIVSTDVPVQNGRLVITDIAGRTVKTISYSGTRETIDVADLADGIYVARLNDGAGIRVIKN